MEQVEAMFAGMGTSPLPIQTGSRCHFSSGCWSSARARKTPQRCDWESPATTVRYRLGDLAAAPAAASNRAWSLRCWRDGQRSSVRGPRAKLAVWWIYTLRSQMKSLKPRLPIWSAAWIENTAPGSFLGALFGLQEGSANWNSQRDAFMQACHFGAVGSAVESPQPSTESIRRKTRNPCRLAIFFCKVPDTDIFVCRSIGNGSNRLSRAAETYRSRPFP